MEEKRRMIITMEKKITPELIDSAKKTETAQELIALAKENGIELTEEQAEAYIAQFHVAGELSDAELDNVTGGGCYTEDGYLKTTIGYGCEHYEEGLDLIGAKGTCCRCKWWDERSASQMIVFGQPAICRNPKQMRKG